MLAVYQLYLNQWLQIRWRRWLTQAYLDHWLSGANHYRMQLLGDAADNPDQRIAEDIKEFIDAAPPALAFCRSASGCSIRWSRLARSSVILWSLSAAAPLHLFGTTFDNPWLSGVGRADLRRASAPR